MKNDNDILKELYYDLFKSYRIDIKPEYQFVYDNFFEHIIEDTEKLFIKNFRKELVSCKNYYNYDIKIEYKKTIFRNMFYTHYSNSQWFYKILNPENDINIIRELRNKKLKKIKNGSK